MIPLKINGTKYNIPTIEEVSTSQYLDLIDKKDFNLIEYLSVVLDLPFDEAERFRVKNPGFLSAQLFAVVPDYTKAKRKKAIVLNGKAYKIDTNVTLGQRFIIEENGKNLEGFDLMIFELAVAADYENYSNLISIIKKAPAKNILPTAFFLSKSLRNGRRSVLSNLRVFRFLMRMLKLKRKLVPRV